MAIEMTNLSAATWCKKERVISKVVDQIEVIYLIDSVVWISWKYK